MESKCTADIHIFKSPPPSPFFFSLYFLFPPFHASLPNLTRTKTQCHRRSNPARAPRRVQPHGTSSIIPNSHRPFFFIFRHKHHQRRNNPCFLLPLLSFTFIITSIIPIIITKSQPSDIRRRPLRRNRKLNLRSHRHHPGPAPLVTAAPSPASTTARVLRAGTATGIW